MFNALSKKLNKILLVVLKNIFFPGVVLICSFIQIKSSIHKKQHINRVAEKLIVYYISLLLPAHACRSNII